MTSPALPHSLPRSAQANPHGPLPQPRPLSSPWARFNSAQPSKHAGLAPRFPLALRSARVNTEPQAHPPARPRRPSPADPGDPRRQLRLPRRAAAPPRKSRSVSPFPTARGPLQPCRTHWPASQNPFPSRSFQARAPDHAKRSVGRNPFHPHTGITAGISAPSARTPILNTPWLPPILHPSHQEPNHAAPRPAPPGRRSAPQVNSAAAEFSHRR